jgi:hypothetical protein
MAARVRAHLDEDRQIIIQWLDGAVTPEEFEELTRMTAECVARLRNPEDVRILIDGRQMGKSDPKVRKMGMRVFRDKGIKKLAVWGAGALVRTTFRFVTIPLGRRNIRMFRTEDEAVEWLLQ